MQLGRDHVNALSSNNEERSETMQAASTNPQQQPSRLNVNEMAHTASQQSQHAGPSIGSAASINEVTDSEEEDPLRDLEAAAERFADSGSAMASDTAVTVNDESNNNVPSTLGLEDRILDIFYRADVTQKASAFETMRICTKAVDYRWRVIIDAGISSQMAFTNSINHTLTVFHDGDHLRVPSHEDTVRIAMSNILTNALSTSDWTDYYSGTKIFEATLSALYDALDRLEKDVSSMRKKAKAAKAAQRKSVSGSRKRKAEDESPQDNTAVSSARGEPDSSPVKKAKRIKKHEEVEWSTAEDVELRDMRTRQNCQWWFSHTLDQRAAHFKTWLEGNHYTHTRSKNALEQRSDMWRKDPQKDPNPNGPPILTKAQCKGTGAQNPGGTIFAGATGAVGQTTTRINPTGSQGSVSANITAEDNQADEESVDVDDIINRHLQPFVAQAGAEAGMTEGDEQGQDEEQEQEEQQEEQQEEEQEEEQQEEQEEQQEEEQEEGEDGEEDEEDEEL
ncbi:hypothetical protein KC318_g386 [Hortaea werneckii]|nr:hypothetical protein KC334_g237 [Hortaea werneckii]KAI7026853.1 hypothetical protein KC355_g501 [Hortaea werneckii]KAI7676255.1 hypothetical protein KC318_g386 [Hortaea werneckii]